MKHLIILITSLYMFFNLSAQIEMDLSKNESETETIELNSAKEIIFKNLLPSARNNGQYTFIIEMDISAIPLFNTIKLSGAPCSSASSSLQLAIAGVQNSTKENEIKTKIKNLEEEKKKLIDQTCIVFCNALIDETVYVKPFLFKLQNNQTITITVIRQVNKDSSNVWNKILKTPEKSRWLIHYGLTYAPNVISKVDYYFSQADTSSTNKYTITKENDNGPKPWENISATMNFTYPFHSDSRNFDGGFTAGFGLNAGFELSGHTGLSAVIGENVIIGTGVAFMQKYKLMGAYKENQVVKTNLNFESLHHKVWLPELYFTIGFRFNSNPFAKIAADDKSTKSPAEPIK